MFHAYQNALLGKMDNKSFPSKFSDFYKDARKPTRMTDAQKWANLTAWLSQASAANKENGE